MPGDVLLALARWAGQTVSAAALTDVWESARGRFARLVGRGDPHKTQVAEQWLEQTRQQLTAAAGGAELEQVRTAATERWAARFADLLDEDPGLETALRTVVDEVVSRLGAGTVQVSGHSVAAGRDMNIIASGGGLAAGVIHGNVAPPDPASPGPAAVAGPGSWNLGHGAVGADRGGIAIGNVELQRRPGAPSQPVRLGPRPVILAGREGLLASLNTLLTGAASEGGQAGAGAKGAAGGPGNGEPKVVVLYGLGGAGKTSLAVEYAYRHLAEAGVCWQFAAEDAALLTAQFAVLAAQLGEREIIDARDPVASVHAVLARARTGWLLVFDNARDRASVEPFVPPVGPVRVLITTQSQHWPSDQALEVPVLETDVAASFLMSRTGDPDQAAARDLAVELGGLPLALEQAAGYMQATATRLATYLPLFRTRQSDLLARGEAAGHPADVAATLGLAVSRLAGESPAAAGLLRLLAFLASAPVPLSLLLASEQARDQLAPEAAAAIGPLLGDPIAAGDAIMALRRYSLVTPAGNGLVLVHRLVQVITRAQLRAGTAGQWERAAATLVEQAVPADPEAPAEWPTCAVLLPHSRAVLAMTSEGLQRIAEYLGHSGSAPAARDLFRLIADAYAGDDVYGPEHPGTLDIRREFARWVGESGDAAGARDQLRVLLPSTERVLGPEHPDTLNIRHELAYWTGRAGDWAGARDQYAILVPIRERVQGPEHPSTLNTRHNLARWTGEAGDFAGARDQFAALLPIRERVQGPEHPSTQTARHELASWAGEAGDAVGARDQFAALVPIRERALGPEHPNTLTARAGLASWTGKAGDAAGARDQYAVLLPVMERVLGPEHPDTLVSRNNLASWTGRAGDAAGARDQFAVLLPIMEQALGPEHPDTVTARAHLTSWTKKSENGAPDAS